MAEKRKNVATRKGAGSRKATGIITRVRDEHLNLYSALFLLRFTLTNFPNSYSLPCGNICPLAFGLTDDGCFIKSLHPILPRPKPCPRSSEAAKAQASGY